MTIYIPKDTRWEDFMGGVVRGIEKKRQRENAESAHKAMGDFLSMLGNGQQSQQQDKAMGDLFSSFGSDQQKAPQSTWLSHPTPSPSMPEPEERQAYGYTPQFAKVFQPSMPVQRQASNQPDLNEILQGMATLAQKYKSVDVGQMLPTAMSIYNTRQAEAQSQRESDEKQRQYEGKQRAAGLWQEAVSTGNRQAMLALYPTMKEYGVEVPADQLRFAYPDLKWSQIDQGNKTTLVGLNPYSGQAVVTQDYARGISPDTRYREGQQWERTKYVQGNENYRASLSNRDNAGPKPLSRSDRDAIYKMIMGGTEMGIRFGGLMETASKEPNFSPDMLDQALKIQYGEGTEAYHYARQLVFENPMSDFYGKSPRQSTGGQEEYSEEHLRQVTKDAVEKFGVVDTLAQLERTRMLTPEQKEFVRKEIYLLTNQRKQPVSGDAPFVIPPKP